jgi:hypothetical protein
MDIDCPSEKSILVKAGVCEFRITPQVELETVDLIDDTSATPKKDITVRPTVVDFTYTPVKDECTCFDGMGSKTGGEYSNTANITLTGQNPSESAEKIDIEVADE